MPVSLTESSRAPSNKYSTTTFPTRTQTPREPPVTTTAISSPIHNIGSIPSFWATADPHPLKGAVLLVSQVDDGPGASRLNRMLLPSEASSIISSLRNTRPINPRSASRRVPSRLAPLATEASNAHPEKTRHWKEERGKGCLNYPERRSGVA